MRATLAGSILFFIALAVLVGGLSLLNMIPVALDDGVLRRYTDIEEVRERLKIPVVYTPAYFPQCFRWPPADLIAQTRPYTSVVMALAKCGQKDISLVLAQTALPHDPPVELISFPKPSERIEYALKGRRALLEIGVCGSGERCSRITWDEAEYRIRVVMRAGPADLLKIAESLMP